MKRLAMVWAILAVLAVGLYHARVHSPPQASTASAYTQTPSAGPADPLPPAESTPEFQVQPAFFLYVVSGQEHGAASSVAFTAIGVSSARRMVFDTRQKDGAHRARSGPKA